VALSKGLSQTLAAIIPGAGQRMRDRLRVPQQADNDVESLAELLAEDLDSWPVGAWLAVDDYHFLRDSQASERFVDLLWTLAPRLHMLITTRERPSWATARRLAYGDIFELNRSGLAMDSAEAADVLGDPQSAVASPLAERARGWPAVLGLAASMPHVGVPEDLPDALYDYFAEELFQTAPPKLRASITRLSAAPHLSPSLVDLLIGSESKEIIDTAVRAGFLVNTPDGMYELHPLLKTFLRRKLDEDEGSDDLIKDLVGALIEKGAWDDAFATISEFESPGMLDVLLHQALPDLLAAGRFSTLETWIAFAVARAGRSSLVTLAEAEVARAHAQYARGETFALQALAALGTDDDYASRAYAVAGECAHLLVRSEEAYNYHLRAEALARNNADSERAVWGQFISSIEVESLDTSAILDRFEQLSLGDRVTVDATLRVAAGRMALSSRLGQIDSVSRRYAAQIHLVDRAESPWIRSFFLYRLAYSRALSGRYREALACALRLDHEVERFRLDFVKTHAHAVRAAAYLGLRQFAQARAAIDALQSEATRTGDEFEEVNARTLLFRLYLARDKLDEAITALGNRASNSPALRGECMALEALGRAIKGEPVAFAIATAAMGETNEIQTRTLGQCARTIAAIQRGGTDTEEEVAALLALLKVTEDADALVWAYRGFPRLLAEIVRHSDEADWLITILTEARDETLGRRVGLPVPPTTAPRVSEELSRREREVYALLCNGLTNREISKELFISESTAKLHVRHILEKLHVRSRTEAVAQASAIID